MREVVTWVNPQGFRGRPIGDRKAPGVLRIACIGDSQTFGTSIGEGQPWPARLEAALRALRPEREVEVLNAGVPGYEVEQEVARLESRILGLEPDLVLLGFYMNDTALPGAEVEPADGPSERLARFFSSGRTGLLPRLRRSSRLLDLVSDGIFRWIALRRWAEQREVLFADEFDGWVRARAAITRARDLVLARGGRFGVVLVPVLVEEDGELLSAGPYRTVERFCREAGIECLDPAPHFGLDEVEGLRVQERDVHCGPEAHRRIGEAAARWIEARGLLPPAPPR